MDQQPAAAEACLGKGCPTGLPLGSDPLHWRTPSSGCSPGREERSGRLSARRRSDRDHALCADWYGADAIHLSRALGFNQPQESLPFVERALGLAPRHKGRGPYGRPGASPGLRSPNGCPWVTWARRPVLPAAATPLFKLAPRWRASLSRSACRSYTLDLLPSFRDRPRGLPSAATAGQQSSDIRRSADPGAQPPPVLVQIYACKSCHGAGPALLSGALPPRGVSADIEN